MQISVKTEFDALRRELGAAPHQVIRRAAANALNRGIVSVRKEMTHEIRKYRSLRAGTIKSSMLPIKRASFDRLFATMTVLYHKIPLTQFHVRMSKRNGVSANVIPGDGYKAVPHAFSVAAFGNQIFVRRGTSRGPLKMLYGPSLPTLLKRATVVATLVTAGTQTFVKRFEHEVSYRMRSALR